MGLITKKAQEMERLRAKWKVGEYISRYDEHLLKIAGLLKRNVVKARLTNDTIKAMSDIMAKT